MEPHEIIIFIETQIDNIYNNELYSLKNSNIKNPAMILRDIYIDCLQIIQKYNIEHRGGKKTRKFRIKKKTRRVRRKSVRRNRRR